MITYLTSDGHNLGLIGLAVLTFIGYKQTDKINRQTDKLNVYTRSLVIINSKLINDSFYDA